MIGKIAQFELRYQLKSPVFWVACFLFFLLGFGLTASDNVQISNLGAVKENAPYALALLTGASTMFYLLVVTAFVANGIIRDDQTGFAPIVRATPVTKNQMVLGRFTGGYLVAAIGFLAVPFGAFMGTLMPWVDAETVGPQNIAFYLWPYVTHGLVNIFFAAALLFMLATITRSMMWSYVGVVGIVVGYLVIATILGGKPELRAAFAQYEPLGMGALGEATRYWTQYEMNNQLVPLEGKLLFNRLFAMGLGVVSLLIALWRFSMSERPASKRKLRKLAKAKARDAKLAAIEPTLGGGDVRVGERAISRGAQVAARTRLEIRMMLRSPGLSVLLLIAIGFAATSLWGGQGLYGSDVYPTVSDTISQVRDNFEIFILIIAAFYGGEMVWRERDNKLNEMIDSAPVPAWAMTVPKIIALFLVILMVNLSGMLVGLFYELTKGAEQYGLVEFMTWFILPKAVDGALIAVLAIVFQVLSPNKYVGWGLILAWFLITIVMNNLGYTNPLYIYGGGPSVPLSDLVGAAPFMLGNITLQLYWVAWAIILAVGAHVLWPRGTDLSLRQRFLRVKRVGIGHKPIIIASAAAVAAAGLGAYTHYNIKVLNEYRTSDEREKLLAEYEKKYLKYETLVQPIVTDVKLDAQLYPKERRLEVSGHYALKNDSGQPIEVLHVRDGGQDVEYSELTIAGAKLESHDDEFGYWIFRFDKPLQPGETSALNFKSQVWYRGFRAGNQAVSLTPSASFINNRAFSPLIGMDRSGLLDDRQARRRQGLAPELRPAKLEDMSATRKNALGIDWVNSDITLTTDADQVPIAPGNKVSDETADGRRTARFVSPAPILQFFSIQSGYYEEAVRQHGRIKLSVFYHKGHHWNVERMLDAMEESLDYYEANYGPYQFDYARIIEFPGYSSFAQAFAGTMPFSEAIGFTANVDDGETPDFITYVIAHELAHQYWAHQVIGAGQQGDALTTETMASYSAIMVMKKRLGEDQLRQFLKYELDQYLAGRKGEAIEELPLIRMENQAYIHYRKGGMVLHLLAERMGEERVNRALARFIQTWKFKGAPYHRSVDLVAELRKEAQNAEEQQLITDLFEKITLYDLKVTGSSTEKKGDRWVTRINVESAKYQADGKGKETAVKLDEPVMVGLFNARPGFGRFDEKNVLTVEQRRVKDGKAVIELTSKERPAYVGIDPYNYLIDRNSDDNVKALGEE